MWMPKPQRVVQADLAHNIADSLASGIGLMIGVYDSDVYAEAASSDSGAVSVNFINARLVGVG